MLKGDIPSKGQVTGKDQVSARIKIREELASATHIYLTR
jgi:hypothetical protein